MFERALSVAPESREAHLDDACGDDRTLRAELASLLAAHDASTGYFERLGERVVAPALSVLVDIPQDGLMTGDTVSHYRILERIGGGGMGVVYSALDVTLGRSVALKFLPLHLNASTPAKARLLAEGRAASRLDHPNIGVIYEIGETEDGRLFIAMAHYEGETLDRRLDRGPLPIDEATSLARQIAAALAAAHDNGVIHRDIKPSNILITVQGVAKLLDFGIAKVSGSDQTREGAMPGTVAYMSPEQTRGEVVDHRTDLWSLGVVFCEMLTGVRPFQGDDDRIVIHAIRHDAWTPASHAHAGLPPPVRRIIGRCLEQDVSQRYAGAAELLADLGTMGGPAARPRAARPLRYATVAALSGLLVAATVYRAVSHEPAAAAIEAAASSSGPRVAVLPLAGIGLDPEDGYLADALTAELIAQLSSVSGLRVIARESVLPFTGAAKSTVDIGRELDVDALLQGSVRGAGDHVRLTLRLVDTISQEDLWTGTFDTASEDLRGVQREIAQRVAGALEAAASQDGDTAQADTPVREAYTLYLKGRYFLDKRDEESARKAGDYFRQALDLDPTYARAWTGWSDTLDVLTWLSVVPPRDAYTQGRAAAERALALDPALPEAHVSLARALYRHYFEFDAAAEHLRRAIGQNPSHAAARQEYGAYLRMRGRFDEALEQIRTAAALDPLSPMHQVELGITLYMARRYDEALAHYRRVLDTRPDFTQAYFFMALVHLQQHQYEHALAALGQASPAAYWQEKDTVETYIHATSGQSDKARARLGTLERLAAAGQMSPWHPAIIHLALGEHDRALDLLEMAFDDRSWQIPLLPVEPIFDPLRSNTRFVALVDRLRR
jgi:TolB-like protein/Tfp pilus assembly protein PilF